MKRAGHARLGSNGVLVHLLGEDGAPPSVPLRILAIFAIRLRVAGGECSFPFLYARRWVQVGVAARGGQFNNERGAADVLEPTHSQFHCPDDKTPTA